MADIRFPCGDAFALSGSGLLGTYELIYDSGCFHHLPPHRRISYLALLERHLAPGGRFGVACFAEGAVGSELSDADFNGQGRLEGGLACTPESHCFGEPVLWTGLFGRDD
ncbi:hypothetical protein RKD20_008540 [Streptomyces sp. SLBN-8D4]